MNATTASRVSNHLRRRGLRRAGSAAIYSVVLDGETALCLTEPQLDTWWRALSPEEKAEIYEQHLGDGEERCKYCGCTEHRACVTNGQPCAWLDPNHTVCSAPRCATLYHAEMFDQVFHGGPQRVVTTPSSYGSSPVREAFLSQTEDRARIDHFVASGQWLTNDEWQAATAEVADAAL